MISFYESERNKLIPQAVDYANSVAKKPGKGRTEEDLLAWYGKWNLAYHSTMNKLAREIKCPTCGR